MAAPSSTRVVLADIAGGVAVAAVKFVAAAFTGSSAMLSEGIHSLIDTGNGVLLWVGLKLSRRPPDDTHPFGHGLELYFWSLIVAIFLFAAGGGMSVYEGIGHVRDPRPVEDPTWNYVVLGCSGVFEAVVLAVSIRGFLRVRRGRGVWATIHRSKNPAGFTVLLENAAAALGLVIAFLGVFLSRELALPVLDGAASIAIGAMLAAVACVLVYESRSLMLGEGADPEAVADIRRLVESDPAVVRACKPLSMYFGPDQILVGLDVQFRHGLSSQELEEAVDRIEAAIRRRLPQVRHIFLKAESITARPGGQGEAARAAGRLAPAPP
jgi:cation diffusion facilitator family transporter